MANTKVNLVSKIKGSTPQTSYSELRLVRTIYNFGVDGGSIGAITPKNKVALPKNAVIVATTINSTTAVTSGGAATVAVGTSAGSSASSLLTATAIASLSANALINGAATFAAPVKLTAPGYVTLTVAAAALTAGVVEVVTSYYVASN